MGGRCRRRQALKGQRHAIGGGHEFAHDNLSISIRRCFSGANSQSPPPLSIKAVMKKFLFLAGINGAIAVVAGALASHAPNLSSGPAATVRLGGTYHLVHALALGLAGLSARGPARPRAQAAGWLFMAGIILFSGGLYLLALTDAHIFAYLVPFGGLSFIAGWIFLALAALKLEDLS